MEVIHLILGKANPQRMNGVNKVVHEMATRQAAKGLPVQVWGITKNLSHNYPQRNFNTQLFLPSSQPFRINANLKKAIAHQKDKAVFHLHGGFIPAFFAASQWLQKHQIPFVFTPHGSYNTVALQRSAFAKNIYFNLFEKKLLSAAAAIHSLGQSEMEGLQKRYPNNRSVRIPYGFVLPENNVQHNKVSSPFIISFCGRLDVYTKGLDALLQGFKLFHQQWPDSVLWLLGDGPEKKGLQHVAEQWGLQSAVVFHGAKFGAEKTDLLQQSHVFATTSRNEGLPSAVLEAASLGLPCLVTIATNTGDAMIKYDAGEVIAETNSTQIFAALCKMHQRIMAPGGVEIYGSNARQMIAGHYNWSGILHQFNQLYYSAFNRSKLKVALQSAA